MLFSNHKSTISLWIAILFCSLRFASPTLAEKPLVKIGSKGFTESVVLGELIGHLARDAGADVVHRSELGGTQVLWTALLVGDIDVYVDYTGTIREELLAEAIKSGKTDSKRKGNARRTSRQESDYVRTAWLQQHVCTGMRDALAEKLEIKTISDLKKHTELKMGFSDEFMERHDGWHQLAERYQLPHKQIRTMDHNLAYRGLEHDAIQVTDLYTTDAEIDFYSLRTLDDDLGFFPMYYAVMLMRDDLPTRAPEVAKSILRLQGLIEPEKMSNMTARVRLDRVAEGVAAGDYLRETLKIDVKAPSTSATAQWGRFAQRLAKTTMEHLFLVITSLSLQ